MPTAKRTTAKASDETTPVEDAAPEKAPLLDPALVERYDLPQEYVDAVNAGLQSPPPRIEADADSELLFTPAGWQLVKRDTAPGESTAISR